MSREEFFEYGLRTATNYDRTFAGTAPQLADMLEEEFEAGGSRGGFMMVHPQAVPRDLLNVVDLLVPELQRRGRFRKAYEGNDAAGKPARRVGLSSTRGLLFSKPWRQPIRAVHPHPARLRAIFRNAARRATGTSAPFTCRFVFVLWSDVQ